MSRAIFITALLLLGCCWAAPLAAQGASATDVESAETPPPPDPVYRPTGFVTRFPGYPFTERRTLKAFDLGVAMSGASPVGYRGGLPFFYLDLAATYSNRFVFLELRSMGAPWVVDALLGVALINLNLAGSDDFPPLRQVLNPDGSRGVWELANTKSGFVFSASETGSWVYGIQTHVLLYGAPPGAAPAIEIGFGAAVTRVWINPIWDVALTVNAGPEVGTATGFYAGADVVWRRALAQGFAIFTRWSAAGHLYPEIASAGAHGLLEAGLSFGNWK